MIAEFKTPACCKHQSIANMDHRKDFSEDPIMIINRVCTRCWCHWYGYDGVAVFTIPPKIWSKWMSIA